MAEPASAAIDPVCGMTVDPARSAGHVRHQGVDYYFCGAGCLQRFKASPETFLRATSKAAPPPIAPAGQTYTCPMHPEIVRDRPGPCPICGMALEPRTVSMDEAPNPELLDMTRR